VAARIKPADRADLMARARTLEAQGESQREIARRLDVHLRTVQRWLGGSPALTPEVVSAQRAAVRVVEAQQSGDDTRTGGLALAMTAAERMLDLARETTDEPLRLAALESAGELGLAIDQARSRVRLLEVLGESG
jgi:transcriptional regulator with XRE-family HTH domain